MTALCTNSVNPTADPLAGGLPARGGIIRVKPFFVALLGADND